MNRKEILSLISKFSGQSNMIVCPRSFVDITNDFHIALFLNQIIYWNDRKSGEWIYKTYKEWKNEIGLSEYLIRKASNYFKDLGILKTKLSKINGSPTLHYKLNEDAFLEWIIKNLRIETEKFDNGNFKILDSSITEITTKTTTNINILNLKNTSKTIFDFWNNLKNVVNHKDFDSFKQNIEKQLKKPHNKNIDDIKKTMQLYNEILTSDLVFHGHKYRWGIVEFLSRGVPKFLDKTIEDFYDKSIKSKKIPANKDFGFDKVL